MNGRGPYASASRTKDRLKEVEAAIAREKQESKTSTRTKEQLQERLREYERMLRPDTKSFGARLEYENRQRVLENTLKQKKSVDVVFMVDCTSSMQPHIWETKNQIRNIVKETVQTFGNEVKIGFVGYRDHCDAFRIEKLDLNEDIRKFEDFLSRVVAMGGGDEPEDVFGGIEAALSLSWSQHNKVLIHIGDAPAHGFRFNNCFVDNFSFYNVSDVRGLRIEDLLNNLKHIGIKYFFGKINNSTDKMIDEFNRVGGRGTVSEVDVRNPKALRAFVVNSVSQTISGSMANTVHWADPRKRRTESYRSLKNYSVCDYEPSWSYIPTKKVQWLCCAISELEEPQSIVQHIGSIDHKWEQKTIMMAEWPFAEGAQRISYKGYQGHKAIVLKEFKHFGEGLDRRENYIEIMETQAVAAFLAKQFNKSSPRSVAKSVNFLEVSVIRVNEACGSSKYYNAEVLLANYKTNFVKWNNNAGYVNEDAFAATLDAFSHWTYDVTGGYLMVVDLQGVRHEAAYVLTDPSIHCEEQRFGSTNFGEAGFKTFFANHICGEVCQRMRLKANKFMR